MKAIEHAIKHFKQQEVLTISVPEWGENNIPLMIYATPMTMAEVNMIQRLVDDTTSNIEHAIHIVILKARDVDGNRLFTLEDKDALLNQVDYKIVSHIAEQIEQHFFSSVETAQGNLEPTPCDISS